MTKYITSMLMVMAGLCWLLFGMLIGWFLFRYLGGGAGLQVFDFQIGPSASTVLVGLVHVLGFAAGACLCFVIGVWLCAQGVSGAPADQWDE